MQTLFEVHPIETRSCYLFSSLTVAQCIWHIAASNETIVFFWGVQKMLIFWTILSAVERFDQSVRLPLVTGKELNFVVACKLSVKSELFAVQAGTNFARFSWLSILLETIPCLRNTPRVLLSEMYEKYSTFSSSGSGQNKGGYHDVWSDFFRNLELLSNSIFCCWTFFGVFLWIVLNF